MRKRRNAYHKSEEVINHRDWSKLSPDLVRIVAGKLSAVDCISCRHVCSRWNHAIESSINYKPTTPWLIFNLNFTSIADDNKIFNLPVPPGIDENADCLGSSHGWLIIMNDYRDVHLVNPLSGRQIPLPSVTTLPHFHRVRDSYKINGQTIKFNLNPTNFNGSESVDNTVALHDLLSKVVLSAAPVLSTADGESWEFTVLIIFNNKLCFAKASYSSWSCFQGSDQICDIIMHSNNLLYIVNKDYSVEELEPCGDTFRSRVVSPQFPAAKTVEFTKLMGQDWWHDKCKLYLVETTSCELLVMVIPLYAKEAVLVSWDKEGKWKKVNSLGEEVAFLGYNHALCLPASACPEHLPDTIYYIDSCGRITMVHFGKDVELAKQEVVSYHIEKVCLPPVWFSPTMNEGKVELPQRQRARFIWGKELR